MKNTKKMIFLSIMLSISLVLYYIENNMPPITFLSPGAKIGISNIISITILFIFGFKEAIIVLFMKVFLSSTFYGGLSTFLYSITGGILSIFSMSILKKINVKSVSIVGISVIGSLFFNIGQLAVSSIILNNLKIFYYLPYMSIVSIFTGIFVGISGNFIINHLNKLNFTFT